ncbi:MAG: hypothetical protein IGBAC_1570 [Ignavibacteriae bacterium]|nr:MAG: hypothetical protein IGBAC_1570 [Ignavibacteriota bacterium]
MELILNFNITVLNIHPEVFWFLKFFICIKNLILHSIL